LLAVAAHAAASAGAIAHAAAVAAASGVYAPDTAADRYFAAWSAFTAQPPDGHYQEQSEDLLELIAGWLAGGRRDSPLTKRNTVPNVGGTRFRFEE
jgi:hypothetical protein